MDIHMGNEMNKYDIDCKILEEELKTIWPSWHVIERLGGGAYVTGFFQSSRAGGADSRDRRDPWAQEIKNDIKETHRLRKAS